LDAAPDFIDGLVGSLDNMEMIHHPGSILEFGIDRVFIPTKRIQRGDLNLLAKLWPTGVEPATTMRQRRDLPL
jgi:hypothetical protein